MVLSMIHVMVCNAGMTIVCGVCGRTIEYGIVAAACDRAPGFGMRVPCPGMRGQTDRPRPGAPALDRPTDRARARWTDRARGRRHRGGNSTPAAGGSRPRRCVRVVAGAGEFRLRRGPPTVDCRPQGLGGGEGGRLRRAGMRVRTWRHSARRNPQAFRLETRRHFSCRPRAGGRNPRLRSQSETSTLARVFSDALGGGVAAPRPARAQNNFTGSTGHARPERTYTEHRTGRAPRLAPGNRGGPGPKD